MKATKLVSDVWRENGGWFALTVSLVASGATFWFAGPVPGTVFLIVVLLGVIFALANSLSRANDRQSVVLDMPSENPGSADGRPSVDGPDPATATDPSEKIQDDESSAVGSESEIPTAFSRLIEASLHRNLPETRTIGDEYIGLADGIDQTVERRGVVAYAEILAGNGAAIDALKSLRCDHPKSRKICFNLADAYATMGEPALAITELKTFASTTTSDDDAVDSLVRAAAIEVTNLKDPTAAKGTASMAVGRASNDGKKADAYAALGDAENADDRPIEAATYGEAALRLNANHSCRFDVAYRYSNAGLNEAALAHYEAILAQRVQHASAANNIGVSFEQLGLQMLSLDHYRIAAEQGQSLAAANMANALISAGDRVQAQFWIDRGKGHSNPDVAVAHREAQLRQAAENQNELASQHRTKGQLLRSFFQLDEPSLVEPALPQGQWDFEDLGVIDFAEAPTSNKVTGVSEGNGGTKVTLTQVGSPVLKALLARPYVTDRKGFATVVDNELRLAVVADDRGVTETWIGKQLPS